MNFKTTPGVLMALRLEAPDGRQLSKSPLTLVVCQVRFEQLPEIGDARTALALHEALGGRRGKYGKMEQIQSSSFAASMSPNLPASMSKVADQQGWRFRSEDGNWLVTVFPDQASLETTIAYTNWQDDFRLRSEELFRALGSTLSPATRQRLGLRYIDQICDPVVHSPQEWQPYIRQEILGPVLHPTLGDGVSASQQQVEIDAGNDLHCSLRHGFFRDATKGNALTYVLDTDVFRADVATYDADTLIAEVEEFHKLVLQVFQACVTPALLDYLAQS
jgi:uncharacterized protein (TIGR04255 family)